MDRLPYRHVDVFAPDPLSGNGLVVFPDAVALGAGLMLRLTQGMRQFESIFLVLASDLAMLALTHGQVGGGDVGQRRGRRDRHCGWPRRSAPRPPGRGAGRDASVPPAGSVRRSGERGSDLFG